MPNFKTSPAGGPSAMKMYGKGKNPIMKKGDPVNIKKTYNQIKNYGGAKTIVGGVKNALVDSYKDLYNKSGIVINKSNKNPKGVKFKLSTDK